MQVNIIVTFDSYFMLNFQNKCQNCPFFLSSLFFFVYSVKHWYSFYYIFKKTFPFRLHNGNNYSVLHSYPVMGLHPWFSTCSCTSFGKKNRQTKIHWIDLWRINFLKDIFVQGCQPFFLEIQNNRNLIYVLMNHLLRNFNFKLSMVNVTGSVKTS